MSFIPLFLFVAYPIGFWSTVNDNEPLGLANALNLAYRFADFRMYPAIGLTNHPGVQFYLTSWLALVCSGHPFAAGGQEPFFRDVIDHVEDYHEAIVCIAAFVGAAGVVSLCSNGPQIGFNGRNHPRAIDMVGIDASDDIVIHVARI